MLRTCIDAVTQGVAWLKRRQKIAPHAAVVKANLGSGFSVADGWIHVDGSLNAMFSRWPRPVLRVLYRFCNARESYAREQYVDILKRHTFVHHTVEYGLPFPDHSVDYLYSSHMVEHLFREDAERLFREAVRVLKKGGRMRIGVPDLAHAVSLYLKGEKEKALTYFFTVSKAGYHSRHRYLYDFELLQSLLLHAGFTAVERCAYRQGRTPDLDTLDNRPEETLFAEAIT